MLLFTSKGSLCGIVLSKGHKMNLTVVFDSEHYQSCTRVEQLFCFLDHNVCELLCFSGLSLR